MTTLSRRSKETEIKVGLNVYGKGRYSIRTPINFLTHMLENFAKHGLFDIRVSAKGDIHVDQHHSVEDVGIVLGQAFKKTLGDKKGINRTGFFAFPMDDSLGIVAIDLSGRPYLKYDVKFKSKKIGDLDSDVIEHFFYGFSVGSSSNVAVHVPYGKDDHHKIEAVFKAFGKAMRMACSKDKRLKGILPSTKGIFD